MAPPSFRPRAVKRHFNPGREPTHEPTQLDRWHRHRCHLDADRLGTGANAESSAAAGRSSARRECRDADPERAAAQGVSREDVEEDDRTRRYHRLFVDDRGDAFGRIEVAYFGPFSYVLAKSKAPDIEAFAVGIERGQPFYNSIIVSQADGPVKAVADIKGKNFGYGDQASTSSHLIPRAFLLRNRLEGNKDYRVVHLGTHDAVARAVQNGQVHAGALSKAIFENLVGRKTIDGNKLHTVAVTPPIPNYPMVMQGKLDPALKDAIRNAFLELKDREVLKTFRAEGFAATNDKAYDVLRETAKILNLDLGKLS
jgi:phosphonate transport system substrate-binding protein